MGDAHRPHSVRADSVKNSAIPEMLRDLLVVGKVAMDKTERRQMDPRSSFKESYTC